MARRKSAIPMSTPKFRSPGALPSFANNKNNKNNKNSSS